MLLRDPRNSSEVAQNPTMEIGLWLVHGENTEKRLLSILETPTVAIQTMLHPGATGYS